MSKVSERKIWETVTIYIFIATSLAAFILVLIFPNLLVREMLIWIPVQVWYWTIIATGSGAEAVAVQALLLVIDSQLLSGPKIWLFYNYYSLLLISSGTLGLIAAVGFTKNKKWKTQISFVFSFF